MNSLFFSTIEVTRQAFYRSSLSYAIVNYKPIVPGHVLVIPTRHVPRLADLNEQELSSLMRAIQQVGSVIERAYGADALTVACQDGKAAGQSVPHVHFHLLPRKSAGDQFSGRNNDQIYPALEKAEAEMVQPLKVDADEDRVARSTEDMEKEATWLKGFFPAEGQ
ncbi:diadenosine tetraphosphate asymmetrical hydrolase [Mycena maculata]|uniref:Bis(5'-adenosyl)-triphosphatase n=1 Tax=Mycena maculata TaxID=230809 RepID=A0AAD7MLX5_9AGAR|nr:diadenosine tetraphosphate asymmetrical hydrolase [Mycena maculata]